MTNINSNTYILPKNKKYRHTRYFLVGIPRLELGTSTLSGWRSNQLSYMPIFRVNFLTLLALKLYLEYLIAIIFLTNFSWSIGSLNTGP